MTQADDLTLPHNLEAERSILGAVLIDNTAFADALDVLGPKGADAFYRDAHATIWAAMVRMHERNEVIDFVTLKNELAGKDRLDDVGGPAYIASLTDGVPRGTNVPYYARIVKQHARRRRIIDAASKLTESAYTTDNADVALEEASAAIYRLAEDGQASGFEFVRDLAPAALSSIEQAHAAKSHVIGVPTGLVDLDHKTMGLQPEDLIIIAARPSMGKTALVLDLAKSIGLTGRTVGFFSLEMSKASLLLRLLSAAAGIDMQRLRSGMIAEREWGKLAHALEELDRMNLAIDDTAAIGLLEMRTKARRLAAEHGLDVIVIDYLQLMSGSGRSENRQLEIAAISRGLKSLAKELKVPVVVLSQLSRAPEARSDKRPMLSDLRESGALEQDADVVMLLYRDDYYDDQSEQPGVTEIDIAKQRNGPTGVVKVVFQRDTGRFVNYEWRPSREHFQHT